MLLWLKMPWQERRDNLETFKDGDVRFLVCTDVAARGIDLKELPFVINLTLPDDPAQYYHRIGRVGRAGNWDWLFLLWLWRTMKRFGTTQTAGRRAVWDAQIRVCSTRVDAASTTTSPCLKRCEDKLGSPIQRIVGTILCSNYEVKITERIRSSRQAPQSNRRLRE